MTRLSAAIVVTGSELVRGDRQDRNGPFLAAEAVRLGLTPERIEIVGDGERDLERAFEQGFGADLCLVSGGLGPTHDDRTVELVARGTHVSPGTGRMHEAKIARELALLPYVGDEVAFANLPPRIESVLVTPRGVAAAGRPSAQTVMEA